MSLSNNRYVIIGASRGLGAAIAKCFSHEKQSQFLFVSRKQDQLKLLCNKNFSNNGKTFGFDCSTLNSFDLLSDRLSQFDPTHIYYISGGGPYGYFADKEFKDHLWAYHLNLLFPAKLIYWALSKPLVKQFIAVGSSIAEDKPDPMAASYASAKHGLKGLITSLNKEGVSCDLRLFSPTYMETSLLPLNTEPYRTHYVESALEMGRVFCEWANDANGLKHKRFEENLR